MSDKRPRICPECGSDTYFAQNWGRLSAKLTATEEQIRRMAAAHGVQAANWELEKINREQVNRWLQQKVDSQRKALNRLENKMLKLGKQPYKDE